MQTGGAGSWRLAVSDSDLAELALFVRDAFGLTGAPSDDLPPALAVPVPDLRNELLARDHNDAAVQWTGWWRKILDTEFGVFRARETPLAGRSPLDVLAELRAVSDPPDFTALADVPQLRAAVRTGFAKAMRWQTSRDRARPDASLEWPVIKQAADDVAFDRRVPVEALRAAIVVLPVVGVWWQRVGPGQLLCSELAARGAHTGYRIAYEVFAASIDS